jgi:hypothetical protein
MAQPAPVRTMDAGIGHLAAKSQPSSIRCATADDMFGPVSAGPLVVAGTGFDPAPAMPLTGTFGFPLLFLGWTQVYADLSPRNREKLDGLLPESLGHPPRCRGSSPGGDLWKSRAEGDGGHMARRASVVALQSPFPRLRVNLDSYRLTTLAWGATLEERRFPRLGWPGRT